MPDTVYIQLNVKQALPTGLKLYFYDENKKLITGNGIPVSENGNIEIKNAFCALIKYFPYNMLIRQKTKNITTISIPQKHFLSQAKNYEFEPSLQNIIVIDLNETLKQTNIYFKEPMKSKKQMDSSKDKLINKEAAPMATPDKGLIANTNTGSNISNLSSISLMQEASAEMDFVADLGDIIKFPEEPSAAPTTVPPIHIERNMRGRILDNTGAPRKNTNFIIYARQRETEKTKKISADLIPILSSKTDALGSFSLKVPSIQYAEAGATVGTDTDILLEIFLDNNHLPEFALLVTQVKNEEIHEGEAHEDCGCDDAVETDRLPEMEDLLSGRYQQDIGGSCVNFTTPNRALEEFTYHNVVRLSDPQIINAPGYVENLRMRISKLDKALKDLKSSQANQASPGAARNSSILRTGFTQLKNDIISKANGTGANGITRREIELRALEIVASALQAQEPITSQFDFTKFPFFHNETEQTVVNNRFFNSLISSFYNNLIDRSNYVNSITQKIDFIVNAQNQFLNLPTNPTQATIATANVNSQFITALSTFKDALTSYKTNTVFVSMQSIENQILQIVNSVPNTETFFTGFNRSATRHFFEALSPDIVTLTPFPPSHVNRFTANFRTLANQHRLFSHSFIQEIDRVIGTVNMYMFRQRVYLLNQLISSQSMNLNPNNGANQNLGAAPMQAMMLDESWMENELSRLQLLLDDALSREHSIHSRRQVNVSNQIQWDAPMPLVQAASISHGHLLTYRQVWRADGYSMGDLLYSLPLAPGQQKQIAIKDWDRKDSASRSGEITAEDSLSNTLSQDRDINEIVSANLSENIEASSKATTKGASFGAGSSIGAAAAVPVGGVPVNLKAGFSGGMSMGIGTGSSEASQTAARNLSGNNMNQLRMKTMQNASSVRSQRTTVVSTIEQSERSMVTTESVGNYNHCHAITIQYFEVLRHLAVHSELVDVQECLFIPLSVSMFDDEKIIRWGDLLKPALRAPMYQFNRLLTGFEAVRRFYELNYLGRPEAEVYYNVPRGRYCDEEIRKISGSLKLKIKLSCPVKTLRPMDANLSQLYQNFTSNNSNPLLLGGMHLSDILIDQVEDRRIWQDQLGFISEVENIRLRVNRVADHEREMVFQQELAKVNGIGQLAERMKLVIGTPDVNELPSRIVLNRNTTMRVRGEAVVYELTFSTLRNTLISDRQDIISFGVRMNWSGQLPLGSIVTMEHIRAEYETDFNNALLCDQRPILDLSLQEALVRTPMQEAEMVSPRAEDLRMRNELLDHINGNLEYYHKAIWVQMDEDRRLMLLEGFQIQVPPRENPIYAHGNGEPQYLFGDNPTVPNFMSLSSVIENRLISIAGNSLVMPEAKGFNLNPNFRHINDEVEIDGKKVSRLLLHYMPEKGYKDTTFRISIPTKGVFAEAVMGACNSCEKIDNTRYWKWEEHPIPNNPTTIGEVALSGQNNNSVMTLTDPSFSDKGLISQQTGATLTDPNSLAAAFNNLNKSSFNDYTGLAANQKNAAFALASQTAAAQTYAKAAAEIAKSMEIPKNGDMVVESIKRNVQDSEKQKELIEQYYSNALGGKGSGDKETGTSEKLIDKLVDSDKGRHSLTNADGSKEEIEFDSNKEENDKEENDKEEIEHDEAAMDPGVIDLTESIDLDDPDFISKRAIMDAALGDLLPLFEQHLGFTFEADGPAPGEPTTNDDEPDESDDDDGSNNNTNAAPGE